MADVRVRLNLRNLNMLMRSAPVQAEVDRVGERIADRAAAMSARAGEDFEYERSPHRWTARGFVQTGSPAAMREQAENAVLERAISGGGV